MERRQFLGSLASALGAGMPDSGLQNFQKKAGAAEPEFYQLRHYTLARGPQIKLTEDYFRDALVPGLNRLGIAPVGVFSVLIGPLTPSYYVVVPASAEDFATVDTRLAKDPEYRRAGGAFFTAPSKQPPFLGLEVSLLRAFEAMPQLALPPATAEHRPRVFELRTYQSPSQQDHERKVEMFNSAEIALQKEKNMGAVFYGDTVAGPQMPSLTYLLSFASLADRESKFNAFNASPEWKTLSTQPQYPLEIVASISNVVLSPTDYSQI